MEVEGQSKKGCQIGHGRDRLRKKPERWFEQVGCSLLIKVDC